MNTVTVSDFKTSPSKIIRQSLEYPVAVEKRNKVMAFLIGKDFFEKLLSYIEDYIDKKAVSETNFKKGKDFEKIAQDLNI